MLLQDVIALQVSLLNMTISCYPSNLKNVDQVLKTTNDKLASSSESKASLSYSPFHYNLQKTNRQKSTTDLISKIQLLESNSSSFFRFQWTASTTS